MDMESRGTSCTAEDPNPPCLLCRRLKQTQMEGRCRAHLGATGNTELTLLVYEKGVCSVEPDCRVGGWSKVVFWDGNAAAL